MYIFSGRLDLLGLGQQWIENTPQLGVGADWT